MNNFQNQYKQKNKWDGRKAVNFKEERNEFLKKILKRMVEMNPNVWEITTDVNELYAPARR